MKSGKRSLYGDYSKGGGDLIFSRLSKHDLRKAGYQ